jgi:hypothetical protein
MIVFAEVAEIAEAAGLGNIGDGRTDIGLAKHWLGMPQSHLLYEIDWRISATSLERPEYATHAGA